MAGPAKLVQKTSDGEVDAAGVHRVVFAVTLTAGADAASVELQDGGVSGAVLLTLKAAANTSAHAEFPCGVTFGKGCYVDFTGGTSPLCSVAYA